MVSGNNVLAASGRATAEGEGGVDSNFIPSTSRQCLPPAPSLECQEEMLRSYRKAVYMLDIFLVFSHHLVVSLEPLKWEGQGSS